MTQDRKAQDAALEAAFVAARWDPPDATPDFLARIEADALAVQRDLATPPPRVARRSWFPGWAPLDWRPLAGLAACLVLGVGIGGGLSPQIGALSEYFLAGGVASTGDFFAPTLEVAFLAEEG